MGEVSDVSSLLAASTAIVGAIDACKALFKTALEQKLDRVAGVVRVSDKESRELGRTFYGPMGYGDVVTSQFTALLRESVQNSLDAGARKVVSCLKTVAKNEFLLLVLDDSPSDQCLSMQKFEEVIAVQFGSEKRKGALGGKGCGGGLQRSYGGYYAGGKDGFKGTIGMPFVVALCGEPDSVEDLYALDAIKHQGGTELAAKRESAFVALRQAPSVAGSGGLVAIKFTCRRPASELISYMSYWLAQCNRPECTLELYDDENLVSLPEYQPVVLGSHSFRHEFGGSRAVCIDFRVIRPLKDSPVDFNEDSSGVQTWVSNMGIPMFVTTVCPPRLANTSHLQILVDVHVENPTDEFKDCDIFDTQRVNLRGDSMGGMGINRIVERAVDKFESLLDRPTGRVVEGMIAGASKFSGLLKSKSRGMRKVAKMLGLLNKGEDEEEEEEEEEEEKEKKPDITCAAYAKELKAVLKMAAEASANPEKFKAAVAELRTAPANSSANEHVRVGVVLLGKVEELLRAEGKADAAHAVKETIAKMEATRAAEMRITTDRDEEDANIVRERTDKALKGRVAMPRRDETTGNRVPTWRESAIIQMAEAIGRIASEQMGQTHVPEFGILYKRKGQETIGLYSPAERTVFVNAEYFVELFDGCSTYSEARAALSSLRETTLHELAHARRQSSSDCHDRQFWDILTRMSNDWDVCEELIKFFTALGLAGKRARASGGAYMLDTVTRTFNPSFKPMKRKREMAKKEEDDDDEKEDDEEEEEEEEEDTPSSEADEEEDDEPPRDYADYPSSDDDEPPAKR